MPHSTSHLVSKYSLRLHFLALLLTVSMAGVGMSRLMLLLGWHNLVARTAAAFCAAYGLFFLLARLWLHMLASDSRIMQDTAERDDDPPVVRRESAEKNPWSSWWLFIDFDELLLSIIVVGAALFGMYWIVTEGPVILLDVLFDLALAGGLVRGLKKRQGEGWAGVLFRRSIMPFLILLLVNLLAVQVAHVKCPGNDRLSEMARDCRKSSVPRSISAAPLLREAK